MLFYENLGHGHDNDTFSIIYSFSKKVYQFYTIRKFKFSHLTHLYAQKTSLIYFSLKIYYFCPILPFMFINYT